MLEPKRQPFVNRRRKCLQTYCLGRQDCLQKRWVVRHKVKEWIVNICRQSCPPTNIFGGISAASSRGVKISKFSPTCFPKLGAETEVLLREDAVIGYLEQTPPTFPLSAEERNQSTFHQVQSLCYELLPENPAHSKKYVNINLNFSLVEATKEVRFPLWPKGLVSPGIPGTRALPSQGKTGMLEFGGELLKGSSISYVSPSPLPPLHHVSLCSPSFVLNQATKEGMGKTPNLSAQGEEGYLVIQHIAESDRSGGGAETLQFFF